MSRFSSITASSGILYYLSLIARMQQVVKPIINSHGGTVVKFEADNCFASFKTVEKSVAAAFEILNEVQAVNSTLPEELIVKFGIDFGPFLVIEGDLWGATVNCASKLGEDLALDGEILVSARAMELLEDANLPELERFKVSQIEIEAGRFIQSD